MDRRRREEVKEHRGRVHWRIVFTLQLASTRVHELGVYRLGVYRLGVYRLGVYRLGVYRLGVQRLGVHRLGLGVHQPDRIDQTVCV